VQSESASGDTALAESDDRELRGCTFAKSQSGVATSFCRRTPSSVRVIPEFRGSAPTSGFRFHRSALISPEVRLPEGAKVEVVPHELGTENDSFLRAVEKTAKPRPHWPRDYALNHGHYMSGEPKKP